jgi:hypothetical protein
MIIKIHIVLLSVYNHARINKFTLLTHYVSLVHFMLGLLLYMSSLTTPTYVTKLASLAKTSLRSLYFLSFHVLFSPVPALLALTS